MSGAGCGSTKTGFSACEGQRSAMICAALPTMRKGPKRAASNVSSIGATAGFTSVDPLPVTT
jgi:hypothetical protein